MNPVARWLLIGGSIALFAGPAIGLLISGIFMTQAFAMLDQSGIAEPKELAESIGGGLIYTATGFFIGIVGAFSVTAGAIAWWVGRKKTPPAIPAA